MAKAKIQYYTAPPTATAKMYESLTGRKATIRKVKSGRAERYMIRVGSKVMRVNGKVE